MIVVIVVTLLSVLVGYLFLKVRNLDRRIEFVETLPTKTTDGRLYSKLENIHYIKGDILVDAPSDQN